MQGLAFFGILVSMNDNITAGQTALLPNQTVTEQTTKRCSKCGETKPVTEFDRHRRTKSGYRSWCKRCRKLHDTSRTNYDRDRATAYRRKYGITVEHYNEQLKKQSGCCYICKKKPTDRKLAVDHNHYTGKVRGLLCTACNKDILGTIERRKNRDEIIVNMLAYIKEFGWGPEKQDDNT